MRTEIILSKVLRHQNVATPKTTKYAFIKERAYCEYGTNNDGQQQGRIQEIQKEGAGTVSAKTLILARGKYMKYKWTITKKVMILSISQNVIKNRSEIRGARLPRPLP
jgi:hypothetical protein